MNKKKLIFFVIIVSLVITVVVSMMLLDTTGNVNQGNFRINDMVINSYAKVNEKDTNENAENISDLTFSLSQKNKIDILIAKNVEASKIYIDNIRFNEPIKKGNLNIFQTDQEQKYDLNNDLKSIEIVPIEKDGQYYIELNIDNVNFMDDVKAPEDTKKITFDGTFFNDLNIKADDLKMYFECKLKIVDITGKTSECNLKFKFPSEDLLTNGISVLRQDISKYVFVLK